MFLIDQERQKENNFIILLMPIIIFFISITYYLSYYNYGLSINDEGILLNGVTRVLNGEVPLNDFYSFSPGQYYVIAFLFKLFGTSIIVERLFWVILLSVSIASIFIISNRILPILLALVPAFILMLLPPNWPKVLFIFLCIFNLLLIYRYVDQFKKKFLLLCGIATGLTIWFRIDVGVFSFLTVCLCILFLNKLRTKKNQPNFRKKLLDLLAYSCTSALSLTPLLLFYYKQGSLFDDIKKATVVGLKTGTSISHNFPNPILIFKKPLDLEILFIYFYVVIIVTAIAFFVVQVIKAKSIIGKNKYIFPTIVFALLTFNEFVYWPSYSRLLQIGPAFYVLYVYLAYMIYLNIKNLKEIKVSHRIVNRALNFFLVMLFLGFPLLFVNYGIAHPSAAVCTIGLRKGSHILFRSERGNIYSKKYGINFQKTIQYIKNNTLPNETIFAIPNPLVYFFSNRKNATQVDITPVLNVESGEVIKFISAFNENRPKLIILGPNPSRNFLNLPPVIQEILRKNYKLEKRIGNYAILKRVTRFSHSPCFIKGLVFHLEGRIEEAADNYMRAFQSNHQDLESRKALGELVRFWPKRILPIVGGYLVWKKSNTWRIRWGSTNFCHFEGKISIDKGLNTYRAFLMESEDEYSKDHMTLSFNSITDSSDIDGLDFETLETASITFDLLINGKRDITKIFLGDEGKNPEKIPFIVKNNFTRKYIR